MAAVSIESGDLRGAEDSLSDVFRYQVNHDAPSVQLVLGQLYLGAGCLAEAERVFRNLVDDVPESSDAWQALVETLEQRLSGKTEAASSCGALAVRVSEWQADEVE